LLEKILLLGPSAHLHAEAPALLGQAATALKYLNPNKAAGSHHASTIKL